MNADDFLAVACARATADVSAGNEVTTFSAEDGLTIISLLLRREADGLRALYSGAGEIYDVDDLLNEIIAGAGRLYELADLVGGCTVTETDEPVPPVVPNG